MSNVYFNVGDILDSNSYGKFKVVAYDGFYKVGISFIDTGYSYVTNAYAVRNGQVKDRFMPIVYGIGFVGLDSSKDDVFGDAIYGCWKSMLTRCYNTNYHKLKPTYSECSVCEEWHSFSNFKKWYKATRPNDGLKYELDKDIKVEGNKLYSPETCLMVSKTENIAKRNESKMNPGVLISPDGVEYSVINHTEFAKLHGLNRRNLCSVINGDRMKCKGWSLAK